MIIDERRMSMSKKSEPVVVESVNSVEVLQAKIARRIEYEYKGNGCKKFFNRKIES